MSGGGDTTRRYLFNDIHEGFKTVSDNEIKIHIQKNSTTMSHLHDFFEIEIVISGSVDEVINGNRISAIKGDMFLITPETYHSLDNKKDLNIISIAISSRFNNIELLSRIALGNDDKVFHRRLSKKDFDFVLSLYKRMEEGIVNKNPYDSEIAKSCINLMISLILGDAETDVKLSQSIAVVKSAMAYIKKNYAENPTLSQVAEHVNISKNYFSVLFKENAGISFKHYVNEVKLNNAAKMLKYTDLAIVDICHNCGYDSLSNFYRKFKERFSVSPQIYRNQNGRELK